MSIYTQVKDGEIHVINRPVTVWDLDEKSWHHNPSIARDETGQIWCSTRHHEEPPKVRYANPEPYSHPTSWLMLGKLDEKTLKVSGVKRMKPAKNSPQYILEKEVEDVRIFWRDDGLHGIGAAIDSYTVPGETRVYQVELLIDYAKAEYKLLKSYGYILGHMEKNWSPPTIPARTFDFIYSPTQVVLDNKVYGPHYSGLTHGGSQVLPYNDGWIRLAHQVINIGKVTHRWYASVAELLDYSGRVTHNSQFFDLGTGWRPQIRESVEFISGAVWSSGKEGQELLISYGLRDETCAFTTLPLDLLKWTPLTGPDADTRFYNWKVVPELPTSPHHWHGQKFAGADIPPDRHF